MADKSKILIIVEAIARAGHPTFALVRESTVSDPVKRKLVENSKNLGVTLIYGPVFNKEDDIGTSTIKAVDGPGTLNKTVLIKPPENIYSFNELIALWEKKIGKTLEKNYVAEEKLLKNIQGH
ncbi:hypothetical protein DKX38_008508 [Salix brachista]|uniref:NmrA-like domain-containing protein n=1 Tax=Salix brachista TaxID=2182728 RepID=A0A5N5MRB4_9ROSI|nr:hypothetical protein DKX38_008508 [Salix brachista]